MTTSWTASAAGSGPGRLTRGERRSPWHGLTASEAAELDDAAADAGAATRPAAHVMAEVADAYAWRTVQALTGNDLRGALRFAEIARRAGVERDRAWDWLEREQLHRDTQRVTHQDPAAADPQTPAATSFRPRPGAQAPLLADPESVPGPRRLDPPGVGRREVP